MFSEKKIAQLAAFFINRAGGRLNHMKLLKLIYLSDRESLDQWGEPISYDSMVSMERGPVLSATLNYINGDVRNADYWNSWIGDKANYMVSLENRFNSLEELDQLSRADLSVLDAIWQKFGAMNQWELSDYTHAHCAEWASPNKSTRPITYESIFNALGRSAEDATSMANDLEEQKGLSHTLSSI